MSNRNLDVSLRLKLLNELSRPARAAKKDVDALGGSAKALDGARGGERLAKGIRTAGESAGRAKKAVRDLGAEAGRIGGGEQLARGLKAAGETAGRARREVRDLAAEVARVGRDASGKAATAIFEAIKKQAGEAEDAVSKLRQTMRQKMDAIGATPGKADQGGGGLPAMMPVGAIAPYIAPAVIGAGVVQTVGASVSIEKSLAEVRKFYDLNDAELAEMKREIFAMVAELGKAPEAIAAIYARAGQQGVPRDQVRAYSKDVAQIAVAWQVGEEAAANGLGTLKTALALDQNGLVKLAGTINTLADGMEGPVAESDLLEYLTRVAGTAKALGGSTKAAVALGAALRSAGDQPEIAATTYNTILTKLATADRGSKDALAGYEDLGFDPEKFSAQMRANADAGMMTFFERIRQLQGEGKNVIGPLADIFGTEYSDNILKFVNVLDTYKKALAMVANDDAGVASLKRTYDIQAGTTAAAFERLKALLSITADGQASGSLESVKQALTGIADVLERIRQFGSVFDHLDAGAQGFAKGLGYENASKMLEDARKSLMEVLQPTQTPEARQASIFDFALQQGARLREELQTIADLYNSVFGSKQDAAVAKERLNRNFDDATVRMEREAKARGMETPEGKVRRWAIGEERYKAAEQRVDAADRAAAPKPPPAVSEANRKAAVEQLRSQLAARAGAASGQPAKVPVEPEVKFDMTIKGRIEGAFSVSLDAAAKASMAGYASALEAGGARAVQLSQEIAARIKAALDITATPTITPRFSAAVRAGVGGGATPAGPAAAPAGGTPGKQSRLDRPAGTKLAGLGDVHVTQHIYGQRDPAATARAAQRAQNRSIREAKARSLHDLGSPTA